jgi:hypothetical protein
MKFWLTVVIGVVAIAGVSTSLMVLSPSIKPTPTAAPEPVHSADPAKQPVAEVVDGRQKVEHRNLGQHAKGQDVFRIKNASNVPLVLEPRPTTCHCTDMFITDHEPSPSEKAPTLASQRADYTVKPGETAYIVARWDTKDKLGMQNVTVPVRTNDPRKYEIPFRIDLDIHKEIVQSSGVVELGMFGEGEKKTASATLTSMIRDKFDIERLEVGSKGFTAKAVPLTAEELKNMNAKSGYRVVVEASGANPVGAIDDVVSAHVKTASATELVRFQISGRVLGDLETEPQGSTIAFREVTATTYQPQVVRIFARNLPDSETLRVGTVKPEETLGVELEKNPKDKVWNLRVAIKPGAPGGPISGGSIGVVDSSGRERLRFRVTGLIDPQFTRTASR